VTQKHAYLPLDHGTLPLWWRCQAAKATPAQPTGRALSVRIESGTFRSVKVGHYNRCLQSRQYLYARRENLLRRGPLDRRARVRYDAELVQIVRSLRRRRWHPGRRRWIVARSELEPLVSELFRVGAVVDLGPAFRPSTQLQRLMATLRPARAEQLAAVEAR
jgi:hypothetical protein